jgi:hypothetical protein
MRSSSTIPLLLALLGFIGCKDKATTGSEAPAPGKLEALPDSGPPAKGPTVPNDSALRPEYTTADGQKQRAGTAFIIQDKAGKLYMLTAAHIMDDEAEWGSVKAVSLVILGGNATAKVQGKPVYIGKAFDQRDATHDLVVWPLADGAKVSPMKLAGMVRSSGNLGDRLQQFLVGGPHQSLYLILRRSRRSW